MDLDWSIFAHCFEHVHKYILTFSYALPIVHDIQCKLDEKEACLIPGGTLGRPCSVHTDAISHFVAYES